MIDLKKIKQYPFNAYYKNQPIFIIAVTYFIKPQNITTSIPSGVLAFICKFNDDSYLCIECNDTNLKLQI